MKRSKQKIPDISEQEIDITEFSGLNTFGPHAALKKEEFRGLSNYDVYRGYIKSRRGSELFINSTLPIGDILAHTVFDAGDSEYVVIQQRSGNNSIFRYIELDSAGSWATVQNKIGGGDYIITASLEKADLFVSNGKIYVFQASQNSIMEYDSGAFTRRKMGMPAPQITEVESVVSGVLKGKRVYGVELVYKDTSVTPNVPIIVSGPNRALATVSPLQNQGALAYTVEGEDLNFQIKVSATLNDGTGVEDAENENWTHIRLYRSLDITTATNASPDFNSESEITGRVDELYQVQEMDRATFLATWDGSNYFFAVDNILDDDIPFPLDIVTDSRLELYPVPPATTGVFQNNKIWASGIVRWPGPGGDITVQNIESKIFYTPESDTIYSENMSALQTIESDPGDGQKMMKLIALREDLVGIKEGKTGIVRNANPSLGWKIEDSTIGITDKEYAQFVPNVGICAIVNDQNDFRIFGFDLQWRSTFAGMQVSRPIREEVKNFTPEDIDFLYINGKLVINGGKGEMLVLAVEQQRGWSKYVYPGQGLSEAVFTFSEGTRAAMLNSTSTVIEIEKEDSNGDFVNTDYNILNGQNTAISLPITTWRFQDREGRSLMEERFLTIVAAANSQIKATAYVNGKVWGPEFGLLLDPADYPELSLKETEYQGYEELRAIGNYIHYDIETNAPCTIYSIMLNCQIQQGSIKPGFDPFQLLAAARTSPPWADDTVVITETGNALDVTITETGDPNDVTITETGSA